MQDDYVLGVTARVGRVVKVRRAVVYGSSRVVHVELVRRLKEV